ncbi:MAG: N-acetylneuraminate synthase family protein [Nitrosotalea sp.]
MSINIIPEIGSNWEGDVELAKLCIEKAKESGASYIKFQMWRAADLYNPSFEHWDFVKKAELTEDNARELKKYADKIGIKWFCSVFNPEAVDVLESINTEVYKIASYTAALKHKFAYETIKKVAETKKRVFISTGYGIDYQKIQGLFQGQNYQFCYCVAEYPATDNEIDWKENLKHDFFSDHTLGITIPLVYLAIKKYLNAHELFVEKHVKLDISKGPDAPFSISFDELSLLVKHAKRIESLIISKEK